MSAPQALKNIVPALVKKIGISDRSFQALSLIEREIQKCSPAANVMAYKNNKIYVEVDSSVHVYELNLRKREILKVLPNLPGLEGTEIKFFLKGTAKPSAQERLKNVHKGLPSVCLK